MPGTPSAPPAYGVPSAPPAYGVPSAPPVYGAPGYAVPPAYGAPSAPSVYGAPSAPPAYGVPSAPPVYGASAPPVYGASAPPAYGQPPYGPPIAPRPTPAFFTGDWKGAAIANAIGIGAMLGLGLIGVLVNLTSGASVKASQFIGGLFLNTAMAAGGSVDMDGFNLRGNVSIRPLTFTLLGYGLIAFYFLRRLRRAGPTTRATYGLQLARVGVVHAGALLLVAALSDLSDGVSANIVDTVFYGMVTLGIALFVTTLVGLPGLFPGKVEYYRGMLAGPFRSILFLIIASSAATFVTILILSFGFADEAPNFYGVGNVVPNDSDPGEVIRGLVAILFVLPNLAGFALLFGMGVPLKASASMYSTGGKKSFSILDAADNEPTLWLWPVVVIVLLVVTGYYSARRSPVAANGRPVGWWLAVVLPVALLTLAVGVNISASAGVGSTNVGFDVLFVILLGAVLGLLAGMLGSVMVPKRAGFMPPYQAAPIPAPPPGPTPPGYAAPMPGYQPPTVNIPAPPIASAPPAFGPPPAQPGPPMPPAPPAPPSEPRPGS